MTVSVKTHKMLWGRAANRCAMCQTELSFDKTEVDDESLIGDECHIIARQEGGPRGDEPLDTNQRDNYGNLVLLCKNHHKQVDDQRNFYTVDKLKEIKAKHETWVLENLSTYDKARQRDEEVYTTYVEEWERKSSLLTWREWTSGLLTPQPYLVVEVNETLQELPLWLLSRVWPKRYNKVEDAFINFRIVLADLLKVFFENAEKENWRYITIKFYKGRDGWNSYYHQDLQKYEHHVDLVQDLTFELTRAANFVCDRVRSYISPSYRINAGRLLVSRGDILGYTDYYTEYRGVERTNCPYPGLERFQIERDKRDFFFGNGNEPEFDYNLKEE